MGGVPSAHVQGHCHDAPSIQIRHEARDASLALGRGNLHKARVNQLWHALTEAGPALTYRGGGAFGHFLVRLVIPFSSLLMRSGAERPAQSRPFEMAGHET